MNQSSTPPNTLQSPLKPPKEFKEYSELAARLRNRGMSISSDKRTLFKLEQIGYYRLSGYYYPARKLDNGVRTDDFMPDTNFDKVVELYVFDKKIRLLLADALERIEIYLRLIIAHELGREHPLAYRDRNHIRAASKKSGDYDKWCSKNQKLLNDSRDDSIVWHKQAGKEIPFWVVIECWDFGQLQYYFKMVKPKFQKIICDRLQIDSPSVLENWLKGLNILRNRCAHHGRTWNRTLSTFKAPQNCDYFNNLNLSTHSLNRLYGAITVIWFFIKEMNPDSLWLERISDLIDEMPRVPGCPATSMGIPESGLQLDTMLS